jgi:hypothetical protein
MKKSKVRQRRQTEPPATPTNPILQAPIQIRTSKSNYELGSRSKSGTSKSKYDECEDEETVAPGALTAGAYQSLSMSVGLTAREPVDQGYTLEPVEEVTTTKSTKMSKKCSESKSKTTGASGSLKMSKSQSNIFVDRSPLPDMTTTNILASRASLPTDTFSTQIQPPTFIRRRRKRKKNKRRNRRFLRDEGGPKKGGKRGFGPQSSKVCAVVTAFNVVDYISQALDSIISQTHQNLQIVVVDDGSTDGTPELVRQKYSTSNIHTWTPTIELIQLPYNTLGGTGQPSNIGMSNCDPSSTFLMFLDGDDFMDNDAVEALIDKSESLGGTDIVMADFNIVSLNEDGTMASTNSYDQNSWQTLPSDVAFDVIKYPEVLMASPVPWRKLYRRDMLVHNNLKFLE